MEDDPNGVVWHLRHEDGWVTGDNEELIMWIPPDLRLHLLLLNNIRIFNRPFCMKLHFIPVESLGT